MLLISRSSHGVASQFSTSVLNAQNGQEREGLPGDSQPAIKLQSFKSFHNRPLNGRVPPLRFDSSFHNVEMSPNTGCTQHPIGLITTPVVHGFHTDRMDYRPGILTSAWKDGFYTRNF